MYHFLRAEFYQTLRNKRFYLGVFLVLLVSVFSVFQDIIYVESSSVLYLFNRISYSKVFPLIILVSSFLSITHCEERKKRFIIYQIGKSNFNIYGKGKLIATYVKTFFINLLGSLLFVLILSLFMPISPAAPIAGLWQHPYGWLLIENHVVLFIFIFLVLHASYLALLSVLACVVSAFFPNIYVTMVCPLIFYFLWANLASFFSFPSMFNIVSLFNGYTNFSDTLVSVIYSLLFPIVFTLFLIPIFTHQIKKGVAIHE